MLENAEVEIYNRKVDNKKPVQIANKQHSNKMKLLQDSKIQNSPYTSSTNLEVLTALNLSQFSDQY